ncbi:hypothetical protein [Aureimonas sp. SK2]|uniref:hypothetical protein n=1 Tax=Aureimonas sp. SK2 TaxID=3015992 RepID=UPI00244524AE|nr:hypothetical protein [Aureimonas sp. SK2]
MLNGIDTTGVTRRLLAAVLLCLSVVLSQMAHASMPSIPAHDTRTSQGVVVDASATVEHAAAGHSHGDRKDDSSKAGDHAGPSDLKCASHCPSVFVPVGADVGHAAVVRSATARSFHAAFAGRHVDTADRPPRT